MPETTWGGKYTEADVLGFSREKSFSPSQISIYRKDSPVPRDGVALPSRGHNYSSKHRLGESACCPNKKRRRWLHLFRLQKQIISRKFSSSLSS
jgi:hypothetical protein